MADNKGQFKKGQKPWNAGMKGLPEMKLLTKKANEATQAFDTLTSVSTIDCDDVVLFTRVLTAPEVLLLSSRDGLVGGEI